MKTILRILFFILIFANITYSQWQPVNTTGASAFTTSGSNIFAGTPTGVFISSNNGLNWSQTSLNSQNIYSLTASGSNIFAGGLGIFVSTNMGTNWTQTFSGQTVYSLASIVGYTFAGTGTGIYVSTNNGTNWTQTSLNNRLVTAIAVNGNYIYAGTDNGFGVYVSTNNGTNWTQTSLNNYNVLSLYTSGNTIFAGLSGYGVHISTNNGANWSSSTLSHLIYSVIYTNNTIIAATHHGGVFVSTNNGTSWTAKNEGMTVINVRALCLFNGQLFAGNDNQANAKIYRRPVGEIAALQQISNEVPSGFSLTQNYPNPFNPVTNIEFSIPKSAFVKLVIYDLSGREIETLVNQNITAGTYNTDWDADKYSSGVYFYKLETNEFSEIKKMVLVK